MTVSTLWLKHRPLARGIARDYFIPGAEDQDVEQEALIGLWLAARDYEPDKGTFKAWATLVINARLQDCITAANRRKHTPLTASLRKIVTENGVELDAVDALPCLHQVSDRVEDREQLRAVLRAIDRDLTPLERTAVIGISQGLPYAEIGVPSQVDNALMRARVKLRRAA